LEGQGITEVLLSETETTPDFRIDAEFHKPAPDDNPRYEYVPIGKVLRSSQYGISIEMNEDGEGIPIYRMNEMTAMLCNADILKSANISEAEAKPFVLESRDVLFNRTNSQRWVGRTGLYLPFSDEKRIFASYLVRFVPDDSKVLPEYLTAFLNSSLGVWDVKRRARISINQSNVNPEEVKAIRIPLLSLTFQAKIAAQFTQAHSQIQNSNWLYAQAERLILCALKLDNWQPPITNNYEVRSRFVRDAARLDADHFHPKYRALLDHVQRHAKRCEILSELCPLVDHGKQPPYAEDGQAFLFSQKYIGKTGINYDFPNAEDAIRIDPQFVADNEKYLLRRNDLVHYSVGAYIGRTQVFLEDEPLAMPGSFITLIRADKTKVHPIYLGCVLNSIVGQMQTDQMKSASAQPYIYPKDIRDFIVPFVDEATEKEIVRCVEESHQSRRRAKTLLERAKRAVEVAIEQDEAAGLKVLEVE